MQVEQGTALAAMADKLSAYGHIVQVSDLTSKVNGAQMTGKGWTGAADPRSPGTALVE